MLFQGDNILCLCMCLNSLGYSQLVIDVIDVIGVTDVTGRYRPTGNALAIGM